MKITQEKSREIADLYVGGLSIAGVARRMGLPKSTVQHHLTTRGVPRREQASAIRDAARQRFEERIDEELLRALAADPEVTYAMATDRTGVSGSALRKHCRRLSLEWVSQKANPRRLEDAELTELAADPDCTVRKAAEILGVSISCVETNTKRLGLDWARRRVATDDQVLAMARDPSVSMSEGARRLGYSSHTGLNRVLRRLGVQWSGKGAMTLRGSQPARRITPKPTQEYLRRAAADPSVTWEDAAKHLGIARSTLGRYLRAMDLDWTAGPKAPSAKVMMARAEKTRTGAPMRQAEETRKKEPIKMRPRKPVPDVDIPEVQVTPETMAGTPGWRWRCPRLEASGWKAAQTREEAEKAIREDLAYTVARRTGALDPMHERLIAD